MEENLEEKIINSGGISGAVNRDSVRAQIHAYRMYDEIRSRTTDVKKIAQNTGWSENDIANIKAHMFYNEYMLNGKIKRFEPDFEQVQAWDRLTQGRHTEIDILLLRHEITEYHLMHDFEYGYDEAHDKANEKYDWWKAVKINEKNKEK